MDFKFEFSPKAEATIAGLIVKAGDINISFLTVNNEVSLRDNNINNHNIATTDKARTDLNVSQLHHDDYFIKVNDVRRIVIFSDAKGNFHLPRLSNPKAADLTLLGSDLNPQSELINGKTVSSLQFGTTKVAISSDRVRLYGLIGYEELADHIMVDIHRESMNIEYFVLVKRKSLAGRPPQSDLMIEADCGRKFHLDWPLNKLGDGTYGVVFLANDGSRHFAVKVLYERQFATRTGFLSTTSKYLRALGAPQSYDTTEPEEKPTNIHYADLIDMVISGIGKQFETEGAEYSDILSKTRSSLVNLMSNTDQATNLARSRFEHERDVTKKIYEHIQNEAIIREDKAAVGILDPEDDQISIGVASHYVQVVASSSAFRESPAYNTIQVASQTLTTSDAKNLSNYAIVMEYCSYTLKDLLEREWVFDLINNKPCVSLYNDKPLLKGRSSFEASTTARRLLGYSIIKYLGFSDRINVGLPFFFGVCRGLLTLHSANMLHHDVKPGNLFVQKDQTSFQVLLGDFSFIVQAAAQGSTEAVLRDVINTGTPHFRSPEQRDFSEIFQVQVLHSYGIDQRFALRVADPKFVRGNISAQDRLVFSADERGILFTIHNVNKDVDGLSWIILLEGQDTSLRNKFPDTGRSTQIVIYKIPSMASDIFGFGALVYDFISAGNSAERFYELLRTVDYADYPGSIEKLMISYEAYYKKSSINSGDENLRQIFEKFCGDNGREKCRPELVRLILMCMCSKIPGCYVQSIRTQHDPKNSTPFKEIEAQLRSIGLPDNAADHVLFAPDRSNLWNQLSAGYMESLSENGVNKSIPSLFRNMIGSN